jgi:predicted dehydrogenase
MKPIKLLIIGAGDRGNTYAKHAIAQNRGVRITGIAEPRDFYRNRMAKQYGVPANAVFSDWKDAAAADKLADIAIISTLDDMHVEPALAFAEKGYHILLEKPIAPTEKECRRLINGLRDKNIFFGVCHVLRYTPFTRRLKQIIDSGRIGEVVSIQRLEPVGYWHQAHSFVRGKWRNEAASSPMLLAKSCHDLDWVHYIMGTRCDAISSFGSLKHFRKSEQPRGAASRCVACAIETTCPYSAKKFYLKRFREGDLGWPLSVITSDLTETGIVKALQEGPYGRCVYECDNDVVDNQVVGMQFEGGKTASFTMTAFTEAGSRKTHIFGTRGELYGDDRTLHHFDFLTDKTEVIDTWGGDPSVGKGHGGGDAGLIMAFIAAVEKNDPSLILTGAKETLDSHLMVFAAERARIEMRVVAL